MFPVPDSELKDMQYKDIDQYVSFSTSDEKSKYIQLLRYELSEINTFDLERDSVDLYNRKYEKPNDAVSLRCFDFKGLEVGAKKWIDGNLGKDSKILVGSANIT